MIKLQHLIVIFIIIIVPITFIVSFYIQNEIDTILVQSRYDTQLMDATYDAIKAFQLNTVNNNYSSVSNSKIRDLEASINTFYNALATSMGSSAYSKDSVKRYTPALVYNLYDGYYIYSNHYNTELKDSEGNATQEYGLEPYVPYSCRYIKNKGMANETDCTVNFTLDNAITVYGKINGVYYSPRTGYLINPDLLQITGGNIKQTIDNAIQNAINNKTEVNLNVEAIAKQIATSGQLQYDNVKIEAEKNLGEYLLILDVNTDGTVYSNKQYYRYTYYNNSKVYADKDARGNENGNYFWYDGTYTKRMVNDVATKNYARNTMGNNTSGIEYYISSYIFSKWVNSQIGTLTLKDAVDSSGNSLIGITENKEGKVNLKYANDTQDLPIFAVTQPKNNPEQSESTFYNHRVSVIRYTIESNLVKAIANYNTQIKSGYEYTLPIIDDGEWDKIANHVCLTTFMQGLAIGAKHYNNYCVVSNNQNKEFVDKNSIMVLTKQEESGNYTYHLPNCKELVDGLVSGTLKMENITGAYTNVDTRRRNAQIEVNGEVKNYYFYHQAASNQIPYLKCYHCIVNIEDVYALEDLMSGEIRLKNSDGDETGEVYNKEKLSNIRSIYFTALAREKYNFYKSVSFLE